MEILLTCQANFKNMEKKITVEINGRLVRIAEHLLEDAQRFGAVMIRRVVKETPKELLKPSPLPEMKTVALPSIELVKRKPPVRSKSIK